MQPRKNINTWNHADNDVGERGRAKKDSDSDKYSAEKVVGTSAILAMNVDTDKDAGEEQIQNIELSVKIGIGMGQTTVMHLGGKYMRMEFVVCGSSLAQAFQAEHHADPGHVILHGEIWNDVQDYFEPVKYLDDGCVVVFDAASSQGLVEIRDAVFTDVPASSNRDGDFESGKNQIAAHKHHRTKQKDK